MMSKITFVFVESVIALPCMIIPKAGRHEFGAKFRYLMFLSFSYSVSIPHLELPNVYTIRQNKKIVKCFLIIIFRLMNT